jgi:hypothetical protein
MGRHTTWSSLCHTKYENSIASSFQLLKEHNEES